MRSRRRGGARLAPPPAEEAEEAEKVLLDLPDAASVAANEPKSVLPPALLALLVPCLLRP